MDTLPLITSALLQYGEALLAIVGATLSIGVGYLVFKTGARHLGLHVEDSMHASNRRIAAQLANEEILSLGDRVGTLDSMR